MNDPRLASPRPAAFLQRLLDGVEWLGNKLPDPVILFVILLVAIWGLSYLLAPMAFTEIDPRSKAPIQIQNLLTEPAIVHSLQNMVKTFIEFPPLGLVIVALLGVGVAEHSGFVFAGLKGLLRLTSPQMLTPMLLVVSILSHSAGDSGYVLIIPLGGVMYAAAGRHPLLGITTAFAGVSGGFSANILPSSLDPLLQGFTQQAAQLIDPGRVVNPLCNWGFMSVSCLVIVVVGWYVSDRVIEPRLIGVPVDGDLQDVPAMDAMQRREIHGLIAAFSVIGAGLALLFFTAAPHSSSLRNASESLVAHDAPLMRSIVPLIFLFSLLPGITYGYVAGTVKSHHDIVRGMTRAMGSINYYLVMAFFAAQFMAAFAQSNLGVLLAIKGANTLAAWQLPPQLTIVGIIFLTAILDLLVGSASAKWALMAPVFVPMLMSVGISPELTQCAYRIGDSSVNIITPLMSYFPLVVVFAQRYSKGTGIGTLVSLMLPYSLCFLASWTLLLMIYWGLGIPLGLQALYTYP